ncbi:MAG: hypothetical protein ACOYT9_04740 [Patescibacteria group bacterium]
MSSADLLSFENKTSPNSLFAITAAIVKELEGERFAETKKYEPAAVAPAEKVIKEKLQLPEFDQDEVPFAEYTQGLLHEEDEYTDEKPWKLRWKLGEGHIPVLNANSALPQALSAKSAKEVHNTLYFRNKLGAVLDAFEMNTPEREQMLAFWDGKPGFTAGFTKSLVPLLALRDLASKAQVAEIDQYMDDYYWRVSLAKSGKTRDPVNYRVAAVLSVLARQKETGFTLDTVEDIFDTFKLVDKDGEIQHRTKARELLTRCVAEQSLVPMFEENARIVGRLTLQGYYNSRKKDLLSGFIDVPEHELYKRILNEMVVLALLKVTPTHPVFERLQNMDSEKLDAIVDGLFTVAK